MKPTQKTHSMLSPSGSGQWMNCPGSVALQASMPRPPQSKYAAEGEAAHQFLENCLRKKWNPYDWVGSPIEGTEYTVTEEMADAVSCAIDTINAELQKGGDLLIEEKVEIVPGLISGTLDAAIVREFDTLVVFDFKYGKGVLVSAVDNSQMLLYLLGLTRKHDASKYKLVIIQPRTEDQVSSWEVSDDYLVQFEKELARQIALTQEKDAFTTAGTWCKWCSAKTVCPALRKDLRASLPAETQGKDLVFPDVKGLSTETLCRVLEYKDRIETFLEACMAYAQEYLESGGEIPGWELKAKRANRQWADEEAALKAFADLGEQAFNVKIKSPAQMEKIAGKERVANLVVTPDTGMTIKQTSKK